MSIFSDTRPGDREDSDTDLDEMRTGKAALEEGARNLISEGKPEQARILLKAAAAVLVAIVAYNAV